MDSTQIPFVLCCDSYKMGPWQVGLGEKGSPVRANNMRSNDQGQHRCRVPEPSSKSLIIVHIMRYTWLQTFTREKVRQRGEDKHPHALSEGSGIRAEGHFTMQRESGTLNLQRGLALLTFPTRLASDEAGEESGMGSSAAAATIALQNKSLGFAPFAFSVGPSFASRLCPVPHDILLHCSGT